MRGAVLYGPRDLRFEERETPKVRHLADHSGEILPPAKRQVNESDRVGGCSREWLAISLTSGQKRVNACSGAKLLRCRSPFYLCLEHVDNLGA